MRDYIAAIAVVVLLAPVAQAAGPICALLDPEKVPQAALLEAKLLADGSATWVDRADVEKVLREQKLQAMFSPEGVGERVRLGKLLKADVLVMVRAVRGAEKPTLEVIVSETASGLRLMRRPIPLAKGTDEDVAALRGAVKEGIARHGEKFSEVVAVPPFVSNDLEFTHDHLKGALAKLAEAEALGRKGVVVVEFAEAEALAKEIALTDPGARVSRALPVYLLGEYRNEGKGTDRTLTLKLRAERGGKPVGKLSEFKVKGGGETEAVRKWAADSLGALARDVAPRPPADPKVEAKVLAERAKLFASLSHWAESLALVEASLLLDPAQVPLRVEAIRVLTHLIHQSWNAQAPTVEELRIVRPLFRRGLDHLEIATFRDDYAPGLPGPSSAFLQMGNSLIVPYPAKSGPVVVAEVAEMRRERREVVLRLLPDVVKRGNREFIGPLRFALTELSPKEKFRLTEELIAQYQTPHAPRGQVTAFLDAARPPIGATAPFVKSEEEAEFLAHLGRMAGSRDAAVRAAANEANYQWVSDLAWHKKAGPTVRATGQEVSLRPLEITFPPREGLLGAPGGIVAVGPGLDVVWGPNGIYVMRERGKLQRVWTVKMGQSLQLSGAFFDGKYFWATPLRHRSWGTLIVVDPVAEKSWEITGDDGLPQGTEEQLKHPHPHRVVAVPLEPGRVCVAGSFGRAWVAVVALDGATGKAAVKVIHEAKEAQDQRDAGQAGRATVDFLPGYMVALKGKGADGKVETRVVLGRSAPLATHGSYNPAMGARPLLIDPDRAAVEVAPEPWPQILGGLGNYQFRVVGDAAYALAFVIVGGKPEMNVVRVAFSDLVPRAVVSGLPLGPGALAIHDGRIHIAQLTHTRPGPDGRAQSLSEWSATDLDGKNAQRLATALPQVESLWFSSHYGLVALAGELGKPKGLFAVEIAQPKK